MASFDIGSAVTSATGVFTGVLDVLVGNPIFIALIGASLIPIGFKIFKSAKSAAK